MGCDTYIYEVNYSQMDISLRYIDSIRGYEFLDYLPVDINISPNNGYFCITGKELLSAITKEMDNNGSYRPRYCIDIDKDYMISFSY